jgi:hypothetical protein
MQAGIVTDSTEPTPAKELRLAQVDEPVGAGRIALRALIGLLLTSLLVFAWVRFGRRTPAATGTIERISIYPVQARISGGAAGQAGMAGQDELIDQLLVFAHVSVHNPNRAPITLVDDWGTVTTADGTEHRDAAASGANFEKLFDAYPQLSPLRMEPLRRDLVIGPGQTADGLLVFSYPLSRDDWQRRKAMSVTLSFNGAEDLTLTAPGS